MPKKKSKKKLNGNGKLKGVGGKADVHSYEDGKRNKSLLVITRFLPLR